MSQNTNTFIIEEADIKFELPDSWRFFSKAGKLDWGKTQYSYSYEQFEMDGTIVSPTIVVSVDKGSRFSDEENYLFEKMNAHQKMGNAVETKFIPDDVLNPLKIKAYYSEGCLGRQDNPSGQKTVMASFWREAFGFHFEMQTSERDFDLNKGTYEAILHSIRKTE